jgi:hypothetical protein
MKDVTDKKIVITDLCRGTDTQQVWNQAGGVEAKPANYFPYSRYLEGNVAQSDGGAFSSRCGDPAPVNVLGVKSTVPPNAASADAAMQALDLSRLLMDAFRSPSTSQMQRAMVRALVTRELARLPQESRRKVADEVTEFVLDRIDAYRMAADMQKAIRNLRSGA